jgi:glycosyltransferase involved in cell wall biosynthesis
VLKLAIVAYSCEPNKGSEPGVAWDFINEMSARGHRLTVFTKDDKKKQVLDSLDGKNIDFRFISSANIPWVKKKPLFRIIHYYFWQFSCFLYFKKYFKKNDFDFVHHITFVNDWTPSAGAFWGLPFILGPVGRHPSIPIEYLMSNNKTHFLKEFLRNLLRNLATLLDPLLKLTKYKANKILVIHPSLISPIYRSKSLILPAIAINIKDIPEDNLIIDTSEKSKIRFFWTGNFIYWKGPKLAIDAFLIAKKLHPEIELHMFGDGVERKEIEGRLKNENSIYFYGRLPRHDLLLKQREMDVFLYPSFEGGGMVVLEAMALRKPVIGLNYGGLSQMINKNCGYLVDYTTYENTVNHLAEKIISLVEQPAKIAIMGNLAKERACTEFSIKSKCDFIEKNCYELQK